MKEKFIRITQHPGYFATMLFGVLMLITGMAACKKETDTLSPAFIIQESEKLSIPAAVDLPANLPNGNSRVATYFAVGVQQYKAQLKAGSNPATYEWVFVAPAAKLYDLSGKIIGTHSAGPSWHLNGSIDSIFGQHFSPAKAATGQDAGSIDWLLLMPKTGKLPTGIFSNIAYIQRIATKGGKAPATLPLAAGQTVDVNYTAVYRFTKKNP